VGRARRHLRGRPRRQPDGQGRRRRARHRDHRLPADRSEYVRPGRQPGCVAHLRAEGRQGDPGDQPAVHRRVLLLPGEGRGEPDPKIRTGNYGDVASVNDTSKHTWQVLCLDRETGKVLWTRTAYEGVPKIKRHLKGSQANCTPATDGKRVVACFGSEGLYCYDLDGKPLWQRDLSAIDSSFAIDQEYEWGFGSSPVIHDGLVILQFDLSHD